MCKVKAPKMPEIPEPIVPIVQAAPTLSLGDDDGSQARQAARRNRAGRKSLKRKQSAAVVPEVPSTDLTLTRPPAP